MSTFLVSYLSHSTVLLAAVWLLMRFARPRSAVLAERLWKLAAVLPVLTSLAVACWTMSREADIATASTEAVSVESVLVENETPAESDESLPVVSSAIEPNLPIEVSERPGRRMVRQSRLLRSSLPQRTRRLHRQSKSSNLLRTWQR